MSENDPSWPDGGETPPPTGGGDTPSPPPPPPPPGGGAAAPSGTQGATLGVRFGARFIDGIITGIVTFVVGFAIPGDSLVVSGIVGAAISLGYFAFLESNSGATPGKQLLNLKVVGSGGGNPTLEEAAKRNIWLAFQVVPFIGGLAGLVAAIAIAVTISNNAENRGWHDEFGGTTVIRT